MFRIGQAEQLSLDSKRCIPQIPVFIKESVYQLIEKRMGRGE